jgi:SAM-dependent methyltransferase
MKFALPLAVFLGAFLLFQVQPMIAKVLLPWFGGTPGVWTTCLLFFQALLLLGYGWAHIVTRFAARTQALVHLGLLALGAACLPLAPESPEVASTARAPVSALLALLASSVALPYLALASSSPLLQAWSARNGGATYRLFALSNAGSLLGLLSYPFVVEPNLSTRAQTLVWSACFGLFALACAGVGWAAAQRAPEKPPAACEGAEPVPALAQKLRWLALAATATALLLAVTNQMCQEVAVVPFLWVLPLSLYLVSFIVTFESERWYARSWCLPVLAFALTALTQAGTLGARIGVRLGVPVYALGLFVACLFCHGELAARRPARAHLTAFYLWIALGGALGGAFVALLAPLVFRGYDEIFVALLVCALLALGCVLEERRARRAAGRAAPAVLPVLVVVAVLLALVLGLRVAARTRPELREARNFYGVFRVHDLPAPAGDGRMRYLTHGSTRHGQQYLDDARRREPTAYFGRESGIGLLLAELGDGPRRVGIIGLGAGVLAAHGRAGDTLRFYEINPLVIELARREFSFLSDSPAVIELVEGDARLALEREAPQAFDVLVLDAFSSDAIPMHLLTVEAFELYLRHLAPGGVLALHLTSRHLDLGRVVAGLAAEHGLSAFELVSAADDARALLDARWILVARSGAPFERPRLVAAGATLERDEPLRWTDDHCNLFAALAD